MPNWKMRILNEFVNVLKMNKDNFLHIVSQGESEQTEFKQNFNRQTLETIVAFANGKGGKIVLGFSDTREIVGITIAEESIQNWQNEIKTKTEPSILPDIETFSFDNIRQNRLYRTTYR